MLSETGFDGWALAKQFLVLTSVTGTKHFTEVNAPAKCDLFLCLRKPLKWWEKGFAPLNVHFELVFWSCPFHVPSPSLYLQGCNKRLLRRTRRIKRRYFQLYLRTFWSVRIHLCLLYLCMLWVGCDVTVVCVFLFPCLLDVWALPRRMLPRYWAVWD